MARVALVLVFIFSVGMLVVNADEYLDAFPNPVVLGRPFYLSAKFTPDNDQTNCSIDHNSTVSIFAFTTSGLSDPISWDFQTATPPPFERSWEAVAFACGKDLALDAAIKCSTGHDSTHTKVIVRASFGIEPANLSLKLQTTRSPTSDDILLTLIAESNFVAAPLRDVSCTIDIGEFTPIDKICSTKAETKELACKLPDLLGHRAYQLDIPLNGSQVKNQVKIKVTCDAHLGPAKARLQCLKMATAEIVVPLPKLRVDPINPVIAGTNFTLAAHLGEAGKDCTLDLPDGGFHLMKGDDANNCTQVAKTNSFLCRMKKDQAKAVYDIHVDSSANATTDSKKKIVNFTCGEAKAVSPLTITTHTELDDPVLQLFRVGTQSFKVSVGVKHKGPSDAVVNCTLEYSSEVFKEPAGISCKKDTEPPIWSCRLLTNTTVPGKDGEGKVPEFVKNFTIPHVEFPDKQTFKLTCNSRKTDDRKSVELSPYYNNLTSTVTDPPKPDDKTVKQPDSYFWTYTIVIINLFLIALVVFVGMWWRNRAIARSMAGAERVDRFNEMEMFSSDHRPLSKAE